MYRCQVHTRRGALRMLGAVFVLPRPVLAVERPPVTVHKDPTCGCCGEWIAHLRRAGFAVAGKDTTQLNALKAQLGVPADLQACHTAEVGRYLVEGHVPAAAIDRLLTEQPPGRGLAVPGMPAGSPGMEGGEPVAYDVILFGPQGQQVFARFRGERPI
jgi:hypothetical protein